jgi:hypothetical protein
MSATAVERVIAAMEKSVVEAVRIEVKGAIFDHVPILAAAVKRLFDEERERSLNCPCCGKPWRPR